LKTEELGNNTEEKVNRRKGQVANALRARKESDNKRKGGEEEIGGTRESCSQISNRGKNTATLARPSNEAFVEKKSKLKEGTERCGGAKNHLCTHSRCRRRANRTGGLLGLLFAAPIKAIPTRIKGAENGENFLIARTETHWGGRIGGNRKRERQHSSISFASTEGIFILRKKEQIRASGNSFEKQK